MVVADTDVFVCGGGPAGLAAAIALRLRGLRVMVADISRPPIDKACGEGLMPDSLAALSGLGVSLDGCETGMFRGIRFIGPKHSASADFPTGNGLAIRRTLLHETLVKRARELDIVTLWETRVSGIGENSVTVNGAHVRCRWIVGADGNSSQVRKWAGLDRCRTQSRRIGLRQHFAVKPWSEYVEIYWGHRGQMYVTPIGRGEVCVALISRTRPESFATALEDYPLLRERLRGAATTTSVKGAPTVTRTLQCVAKGNVALIGEASGSSDAITGEGLAMGFRQANALASAIVAGDLSQYQRAHRKIAALPHTMARAMLLMDRSAWIRRHALRAFDAKPNLFQQLLCVHVGAMKPSEFGITGALNVGWNLLTA